MRRAAVIVAACVLPSLTLAGVPEALKLLQENRAIDARSELERSAAEGDTRSQGFLAMYHWYGFDGNPERQKACRLAAPPAAKNEALAQAVLARCHLLGVELPIDREKALSLARASALAGNHEGGFVFYQVVLTDPALSYMVDGKPDQARYAALAARPLEARVAEIEALDFLARGADAGHRTSQIALASYLFDTLGERNRAKARMIYSRIQNLPEPLGRLRDMLAQADSIAAESFATVTLLRDAQTTGILAAMVIAYPPTEGKKPDCKDIRMKSARIATPLQDAVYLPHTHPFLQRSYLVRGNWEEDWVYAVCGKDVTVRIRFDADGFSGARFTSQQGPFRRPADNQGSGKGS